VAAKSRAAGPWAPHEGKYTSAGRSMELQRPYHTSEPRRNNNIPGDAILMPKFKAKMLRIPRATY